MVDISFHPNYYFSLNWSSFYPKNVKKFGIQQFTILGHIHAELERQNREILGSFGFCVNNDPYSKVNNSVKNTFLN